MADAYEFLFGRPCAVRECEVWELRRDCGRLPVWCCCGCYAERDALLGTVERIRRRVEDALRKLAESIAGSLRQFADAARQFGKGMRQLAEGFRRIAREFIIKAKVDHARRAQPAWRRYALAGRPYGRGGPQRRLWLKDQRWLARRSLMTTL